MVSRRQFIKGDFKARRLPQRPPWALAEQHFVDACTRCGDCVAACPQKIVVTVRAYPEVDFMRGECTFCTACVEVCKAGALLKKEGLPPWTLLAGIADTCLAHRGVECRVCGDPCPVSAIRFRPRLGGPPLPEVDAGSCTGCGACVAPCPVSAIGITS